MGEGCKGGVSRGFEEEGCRVNGWRGRGEAVKGVRDRVALTVALAFFLRPSFLTSYRLMRCVSSQEMSSRLLPMRPGLPILACGAHSRNKGT